MTDAQRDELKKLIEGQGVNLLVRAAEMLHCSELEALREFPAELRRFAPVSCFRELWNEMVEWGVIGLIMCQHGFSVECKGRLGRLHAHGGMLHFYGEGLAGHVDPAIVGGVAFVSLPVRGEESHSVRFFDKEGGTIASVYIPRDADGRIIPSGRDAFFDARSRYEGEEE